MLAYNALVARHEDHMARIRHLDVCRLDGTLRRVRKAIRLKETGLDIFWLEGRQTPLFANWLALSGSAGAMPSGGKTLDQMRAAFDGAAVRSSLLALAKTY
jgi:hypothetical protein